VLVTASQLSGPTAGGLVHGRLAHEKRYSMLRDEAAAAVPGLPGKGHGPGVEREVAAQLLGIRVAFLELLDQLPIPTGFLRGRRRFGRRAGVRRRPGPGQWRASRTL
jgi:hypothetical protein